MYILKCADDTYYTGSTKNLEFRLAQHQAGEGANHTKKSLPVTLVYFEEYNRIDKAFYREKQVQGWRREKKEALINGHFDLLPKLASTSSASESIKLPSTSSTNGNKKLPEPVEGNDDE